MKLQECILSLTLIIKCEGVFNTLTIYPSVEASIFIHLSHI